MKTHRKRRRGLPHGFLHIPLLVSRQVSLRATFFSRSSFPRLFRAHGDAALQMPSEQLVPLPGEGERPRQAGDRRASIVFAGSLLIACLLLMLPPSSIRQPETTSPTAVEDAMIQAPVESSAAVPSPPETTRTSPPLRAAAIARQSGNHDEAPPWWPAVLPPISRGSTVLSAALPTCAPNAACGALPESSDYRIVYDALTSIAEGWTCPEILRCLSSPGSPLQPSSTPGFDDACRRGLMDTRDSSTVVWDATRRHRRVIERLLQGASLPHDMLQRLAADAKLAPSATAVMYRSMRDLLIAMASAEGGRAMLLDVDLARGTVLPVGPTVDFMRQPLVARQLAVAVREWQSPWWRALRAASPHWGRGSSSSVSRVIVAIDCGDFPVQFAPYFTCYGSPMSPSSSSSASRQPVENLNLVVPDDTFTGMTKLNPPHAPIRVPAFTELAQELERLRHVPLRNRRHASEIIFVGSRTHFIRERLVKANREHPSPHLNLTVFPSFGKDAKYPRQPKALHPRDHVQFAGGLAVRGNSASQRDKYHLSGGVAIVRILDPLVEPYQFYHDTLHPYVHYLPVPFQRRRAKSVACLPDLTRQLFEKIDRSVLALPDGAQTATIEGTPTKKEPIPAMQRLATNGAHVTDVFVGNATALLQFWLTTLAAYTELFAGGSKDDHRDTRSVRADGTASSNAMPFRRVVVTDELVSELRAVKESVVAKGPWAKVAAVPRPDDFSDPRQARGVHVEW